MHVTQDAGTRGLAPAYLGSGIGELIGAAVAFAFIRRDSLRACGTRNQDRVRRRCSGHRTAVCCGA